MEKENTPQHRRQVADRMDTIVVIVAAVLAVVLATTRVPQLITEHEARAVAAQQAEQGRAR